MEVEHPLKRKAHQYQDENDASKAAKVDGDFGSREDIDKENEPAAVSVKVKSFDDVLNKEDDESDDERGPNPEDIVLNIDSLRKFQQVVDPDFDLNEIESRGRLSSHAAYDRAMVGRAQQRRLPGKVANVTQSRPTLVVTEAEKYGRSQSFGGRQLSNSPMLDAEEQRMALTPDERQKQIISKLKEQSSNPLAGLARALKHGPRRSFGKSRHNEADPSPPKVAPVTKPKPKPTSKLASEEKEEKSGGFLFRRRSFNDKKVSSAGDDDSFKGSPKVSKKFGLKIGGSGGKKPPVKSKPVFSTSSTGENDSILSEDIPQMNSSTSTPSKTYEPKQEEKTPEFQKTSTPYRDGTPPSRRERTPNERDSSLFKDPPPLFGHRSVLFGSAEFDAIFEKFSKEDEEASKESKTAGDDTEPKDKRPTPSKKPEVSAKPSWTGRAASISSDKPSNEKIGGLRVSEGRALFERSKSPEEAVPKKSPNRKGFGGVFSKYEDNARKFEEKTVEVKENKKDEKAKEDTKMEATKASDGSSKKPSLFEDEEKIEAMETEENEASVGKKKSLFGKHEAESTATSLFKDTDDDDLLFGDKDKKETATAAKKTVYDSLFSTEEQTSTTKKTGSLFDEEHSDDDELFKTTKKPQKETRDLSAYTAAADKDVKMSTVLADEDESPLFGKPKSPAPDSFSKEKEQSKEPVKDDDVMEVDEDKTKKEDSPGLFDKPSSPLFESEVQRSTSIFEGKRSKSEEDLFQMEKGKDPEVKETDVAGGYLLVDVDKKKNEAAKSLFDDDKLLFDDSDVLPKLEKDSKEKKGQFEIDDFVMVETQEASTTESVNVEKSTTDPLSDEKNNEVALEEFPPKKLTPDDEAPEEKPKESMKEKQVDSDKPRTRHGSAEKKKDSLKDGKKSSDDKPAWMVEAQRRKERRLLEKEKEKEKKLQGAKDKTPITKRNTTEQSKPPLVDVKLKKSNISATTSVAKKPVVEDDMPEWQKKLMERKQRVAEQKKTMLSSSKETTYTSRRERQKDTASPTVTAASNSVVDKKKEDEKVDKIKEDEKVQEDDKVEEEQKDDQVKEKEQKETEEQPKTEAIDEEKGKSKSPLPSPLPDKPLLSPKPTLDEVKSPTRTTSMSSPKPELRKKPSVEVIISSTKKETRRTSAGQEKDKSPIKDVENEPEKSSPSSRRRRVPSGSDKKTVSVSSKVSTSVPSSRNGASTSDSSVPKWKRELQQKRADPEKKDKVGRDTVVSPTQESIPEWKRQLLEKRKQRQSPTPTEDKEFILPSSSSKTDKQSTDKPNYRSLLTTTRTPATTTPSPKPSRRNASSVNKEVPEFMKEFKSKGRSARDSKS